MFALIKNRFQKSTVTKPTERQVVLYVHMGSGRVQYERPFSFLPEQVDANGTDQTDQLL